MLELTLVIYISCCLYQFHMRWVVNANSVSVVIWALLDNEVLGPRESA